MADNPNTNPNSPEISVTIETHEFVNGNWQLKKSRTINHDSHDDRIWLGRHCFWAIRNGYKVVSIPL